MKSPNRYKGLRPNAELAVCPPLPSLAARWGLRHFLDELYWKSSHFKGLGTRFGQDEHRDLHSSLGRQTLRELMGDAKDPIEHVLAEVCRLCDSPLASIERWRLSEATLNARLVVACSIAGPATCGALFSALLPESWDANPLHPARLDGWLGGQRTDRSFGQPDLLLISEAQLIMVEMKVRGKATAAAQYDAGQLIKYVNLAQYAREHLGMTDIAHLILAPTTGRETFYHQSDWVERIDPASGAVDFRLDGLPDGARPGCWRDYLSDPKNRRLVGTRLAAVPVRLRSYRQIAECAARQVDSDPGVAAVVRQLKILVQDSEHASHATA